MKAQYNRVKKLAQQLRDASAVLDNMIEDRWGFHYSNTDDSAIIDCLDYAIGDLDYKDFVERMDNYEKQIAAGRFKLNP